MKTQEGVSNKRHLLISSGLLCLVHDGIFLVFIANKSILSVG